MNLNKFLSLFLIIFLTSCSGKEEQINVVEEQDIELQMIEAYEKGKKALEEGADHDDILATSTEAAAKRKVGDQKQDAHLDDKLEEKLDEQLEGRESDDQMDNLLAGLGGELKARVLSRLASAKSVIVALGNEGKRYRFYPDDKSDDRGTKLTAGISRQMGIVRRMKTMERAAEIYPHLSTLPLNKMVRDGDISDGIEFHPKEGQDPRRGDNDWPWHKSADYKKA